MQGDPQNAYTLYTSPRTQACKCISKYFDAGEWIYYERAHFGQMYREKNVASNKVNADVLHRNEERKICKEVLCGQIKLGVKA